MADIRGQRTEDGNQISAQVEISPRIFTDFTNKISPLVKVPLKVFQARQLNCQTEPLLEQGQIVQTGDRFPERIGHLPKACFQHRQH